MVEACSSRARSRLTRLPWWLPLVLGAVLALDTCSRPDSPRFRTTAGAWVGQLVEQRGAAGPSHAVTYLVRLDESGSAHITPFWADHSDQLTAEREGAVRFTLFNPQVTYSGFWGLTTRTDEVTVLDDPGWSPSQRRSIGQAIEATLAEEGFPEEIQLRTAARMFRDGVSAVQTRIPAGYVHNTITAALALAFLWSCTLGRPWKSWAAMRRAHHLWHGRCPRCRYPTRGYDGTICPECGHDHNDPPTAPC